MSIRGAWLFAAALIFCSGAGAVGAEPRTGFGLNFGIATHDVTGTFKSGQGTQSGRNFNYRSAGLSIGIDYQIAVSNSISLSPFLTSSSETVSGDLASGTSAGHGILGLEGRFWLDRIFIGGHVARYSELLINSGRSNTSAGGSGLGLVAGWEEDHGGLYVLAQVDRAKLNYSDADSTLSGFRLSVGYRW